MTIVRRARVADAAVLGRLLWEFNTEFDSETDDAEVLGARFGRLLVLPEILAVLAEDGAGEAVGFALVSLRPAIWFDGPVSQLEELYVVPRLRSRGIGSSILERCRELVRERGSPEMHINVDEVDTDTRRFYEWHGFVNVEEGPNSPPSGGESSTASPRPFGGRPRSDRSTSTLGAANYRMRCYVGPTASNRDERSEA
jgi:GNAT superfamily N-acetyltransferase